MDGKHTKWIKEQKIIRIENFVFLCIIYCKVMEFVYLNVKFLCQSPEAEFEDSRKVPQRQTQGGFKDVSLM